MVIWFFILSCQSNIHPMQTEEVLLLSPTKRLARASLDIRGIRPSLEELNRIESNPDEFDLLVDEFLYHPTFGTRIREIFGEIYTTEKDFYPINADIVGLSDQYEFASAIGQEPLRLIQEVVVNDMPWSTIVTADWTMANEIHGEIYPIDYPPEATGWMKAHYTDGRPSAGILSTNGLWWVYGSTSSNANRKRGNTVSRLLLCHDYLLRPIEFSRDLNLLDNSAVEEAVSSDPACVSCHQTLDPLSAHFFGFWSPQQNSWIDLNLYHPDRERLYEEFLGVGPSYYGMPSTGLNNLGSLIAGDSRFGMCVVKQLVEQFHQAEAPLSDMETLSLHRNAFIESDQNIRELIRSIILQPEYSASRWDSQYEDQNARLLHIDQLASSIEDLTGFRWTFDGLDILRSSSIGLRILGGGADGETVFSSATHPNATMLLTQARLAELSAAFAVENEALVPKEERRLFSLVDLDTTNESNILPQIRQLHLLVLSQPISEDGPEATGLHHLYTTVSELESSSQSGWKAVLTALLRDPSLLIY